MRFLVRSRRSAAQTLLLLTPILLLAIANPAALHAQSVSGNRVSLPDSFRPVAPRGAESAAVPAALSRDALTDAEAAAPLHVETVLKLRHFAELERRVAAGETVSRAEMAARYLPRESDYRAVAQWMRTQGLVVTAPGASHAVVLASGTPARLAKAFGTRFARVAFRGSEYTAAVAAPSVPAEIEARVGSIHGLQPYLRPHRSGPAQTAATTSTTAPPYRVSDILQAYDVSASGLTGAGQQIGIVIDTVPLATDLTKFWSDNGVGQTLSNIITVNVTGQNLPAPTGEETLDVSWASAMAPGAQIVIYACGDLDNVNAGYSRILDDLQDGSRPSLHQISMSYGAGETTDETTGDMNSTHEIFTAISAYGVSLFASSGDEGACGDGGRTVEVLYPASDPNVTGVGGTSLVLNPATGAVASETAWSPVAASTQGSGSQDSSGGGISSYFARPAWQAGSTMPAGTMRLVPDVALAADPNEGCYLVLNGQVDQYGGTSWAAPCWAALCALANQSRAASNLTALSGANPSLYPALGTTGFRDITSGNNGVYAAGTGYDLVTGLGVPDFNLLLPALGGTTAAAVEAAPVAAVPAPVAAEPAPALTSASTASGTVGTAFAYQITASNSPGAFTAAGLPDGLSVDAVAGLISGTPTTAGTYAVTLGAANGGGTSSAALTLTIIAPLPLVTLTPMVTQLAVGSGKAGVATLTIPNALPTDLFIYYTLGGTAANGVDYVYLKGRAKLKAGRTSKVIKLTPQGDLGGASSRVVGIVLAAGDDYTLGSTGTVNVNLVEP